MSVEIKSGASADLLVIDPTSLAARSTLYDTAGNPISGTHPLNVALPPGTIAVENLVQVNGTNLTARDWSLDFAKLQNEDIARSALLSGIQGISTKTLTDVVAALLSQVVLAAGSNTIGKVDQGVAGASPWNVNVGNFPATQPVSGTFWQATQPVSGTFFQTVQPVNGTINIAPSTLMVTAVGAAAAAVTLTLPAVAGQFHYITSIEITLYNSAARTGSATPVTVTSSNLPGNPAFSFQSVGAIGTKEQYLEALDTPLRSATVNTNTTIVCPATTGIIWRLNVQYYTAP